MTTCPSEAPADSLARLLSKGAAYLCRHGVSADEAQTQAEILFSEGLGFSRADLLLRQQIRLSPERLAPLRKTFQRVAAGEPIQYVVGHWPFHDIELKVDARALIPRPETEELVERVLRHPLWARAQTLADIGTGTGAIVLALAAARRRRGIGPTRFIAVDLSADALALAQENAAALGLADAVAFRLGNGAAALLPDRCDILVSNPPYIASAAVDALPPLIREHEPRLALDGGEDGLIMIRQLLLDATQVLNPGGRLFLEVGDEQGLSMRRLLDYAGYAQVVIARDFAGHDRFAEGSLL